MAEAPPARLRSILVFASQFEESVCLGEGGCGYEVSSLTLESVRKVWTDLLIPEW